MTDRPAPPGGDNAPRRPLRPLPPVQDWNPPDCGDIGLRIDRNGVWRYRDSEIRRPALTRLFSTILRRDPDGYVLVTPVEKVRVAVEDAPFVAVELQRERDERGAVLNFRTNVDDWATADAEHPLRFECDRDGGLKPYVKIRGDLWALLARSLVMDLLEEAEVRDIEGVRWAGVVSCGVFFPIAPADEGWDE